jgi:hypothetical protein
MVTTKQRLTSFRLAVTILLRRRNDVRGTAAGDNDPKFVNYPLNTLSYKC